MTVKKIVSSGNIWTDLGRSPNEAAKMKIRSKLMMRITDYIEDEGLTQAQAAEVFGVSQPRVSRLVTGKINLFSIDMLIDMATKAGLTVEVDVYA